jgi:PAS domain S-box-containing protein
VSRFSKLLVLPRDRSQLTRYGVPVLALMLAIYGRTAFENFIDARQPFALLLPAVTLAAWFGGGWAGVATVVAGAFIGIADLPQPFLIADVIDATRLGLFLLNSAIATLLCSALHRAIEGSKAADDEAARNFEIMANNAPALMWLTDAAGRCVFVNRNWMTFTGGTFVAGSSHSRPGQLHPADAARYQNVSKTAIDGRKPFQIEYRLRRADGTYRWLLEQAVPRFGRGETFEGFTGSCSDVTDSRDEREELAMIARLQGALAESLDLDKCAEVLVQALLPRCADWCCIELVNDDGQLERVRAQHITASGPSPASQVSPESKGSNEESRTARIVRTGELLWVREADQELLQLIATDDAHLTQLRAINPISYLGVPLRARGHIIGVLALATAESGRSLREEDCRLVQKIAGIAGFALDNARLYRSARQALAAEEHALREMERSERRLRFIWDANIFGMCTVARSGRVLTANHALSNLLGYSLDEIAAGKANFHERTAPAWRAVNERANLELLLTGRCAPYEKEYVRPDGKVVQILVCGSLLPDSDDCMAFVLDLTARKHAERALDRQRMLLKTIIDAMPAMVGYIGTDEKFWLHNEKYQKWLGVESDAIIGKTMGELVGEESHQKIAPYLQAAFRGRNMRHETTLKTADRERHLIASYRPDRDADGRVCGVVIHTYDITERKETEQALAEALTRYRFLADAMPQMIWTALPDGQLDYVNHRWLETTGMTEAASLNRDGWLDAVHTEDRDATHGQWRQAVAQSTPFQHECRLRCGRDGSWRWHLVRALPRRDDQGLLVQWVGSATDIDEQRRAYAELAEARERLRSHADELENRVRLRTATLREANAELEAFTYSVSHDLRTPLQFVRGFAEAIRSDALDTLSPDNRDYLQRIIRAASRMDTIIQDLLGYSRLSRAEMQVIELSLDEVVSDVLMHHQAIIKQTCAVVTVQRPLPNACADHTGLFQALCNLVSNSLKFTRPGQPPEITIRAETTDHGVRLWVEDRGIGIDARHHERIFQLFERLHSNADYPGTGIGLSLVRKAVTRMGGNCGVDSSPDTGSRFWIEFPSICIPTALSHAST